MEILEKSMNNLKLINQIVEKLSEIINESLSHIESNIERIAMISMITSLLMYSFLASISDKEEDLKRNFEISKKAVEMLIEDRELTEKIQNTKAH